MNVPSTFSGPGFGFAFGTPSGQSGITVVCAWAPAAMQRHSVSNSFFMEESRQINGIVVTGADGAQL
ncbi:conserved hypothetical protein [Ricinus communis]|uniref:Uncharacterized protein n=1 Tax=Ricinus communis TaxID=3988 RepID=B9TBT6_RICCO|nr:conserved hypothetical protein [Ricinus communis]